MVRFFSLSLFLLGGGVIVVVVVVVVVVEGIGRWYNCTDLQASKEKRDTWLLFVDSICQIPLSFTQFGFKSTNKQTARWEVP